MKDDWPAVLQVWGEGVRAGMYPISDTEVYWFTCFNAPSQNGPASPEVSHHPSQAIPITRLIQLPKACRIDLQMQLVQHVVRPGSLYRSWQYPSQVSVATSLAVAKQWRRGASVAAGAFRVQVQEQKREALESVSGWPFGVPEAVSATAASVISRGRLGDR